MIEPSLRLKAMMALVLGFNLLSDGLTDLLDPKRRGVGK